MNSLSTQFHGIKTLFTLFIFYVFPNFFLLKYKILNILIHQIMKFNDYKKNMKLPVCLNAKITFNIYSMF